MGISICMGGGYSHPRHNGARTCGKCDGCPKDVGKLTRYDCPVTVFYRRGGSAPVCMSERFCRTCLPVVRADPHDDCLKYTRRDMDAGEDRDATGWNRGHEYIKITRGREVYLSPFQEVA